MRETIFKEDDNTSTLTHSRSTHWSVYALTQDRCENLPSPLAGMYFCTVGPISSTKSGIIAGSIRFWSFSFTMVTWYGSSCIFWLTVYLYCRSYLKQLSINDSAAAPHTTDELTVSTVAVKDSSSSGRRLMSSTSFGPETMTIQRSSRGILKAEP